MRLIFLIIILELPVLLLNRVFFSPFLWTSGLTQDHQIPRSIPMIVMPAVLHMVNNEKKCLSHVLLIHRVKQKQSNKLKPHQYPHMFAKASPLSYRVDKKIAFFYFELAYLLTMQCFITCVPHLYHVVTFSGTKIGGVPNCPMFNGVPTYNIGQLGTSLIQCLKISQP